MMLFLIEKLEIAAFKTLLVNIPESAGLLAFGTGLVLIAVYIRRLLAKTEIAMTDEKLEQKTGLAV